MLRSPMPNRRPRPLVAAACAVLTAALLVGVLLGGGGPLATAAAANAPQPASLILDFSPNAIHSGIYTAVARHYDTRNGVNLQVRVPGQSTDAVSLLTAGRVNFAILDIHDLAIADAQGRRLVGIMALVQRPLASVIAQPRFTSPRQLEGQTVGVTGDPSDLAVLRSIVAGAGGKPDSLRTLTIGYDAVPDLLSGRVAAATAFWNDEGVQLAQHADGHGRYHIFRVENYGAPAYPELILTTTRSELNAHPHVVRAVVHTLVDGYDYVLAHPRSGAQALESQVSGLSPGAVNAQLKAELPAFLPRGGGAYGALVPAVLRAWAKWEVRFGIVRRPPDLATMFDSDYLPR
jgi:putative hydroxymethylpyrimidine transport system substrate-binding protein